MLTSDFSPVVLEVNHMPSFSTDSPLDYLVKSCLIRNTFRLLNLKVDEKLDYYATSSAESQIRLYGDIFNSSKKDKTTQELLKDDSEIEESYWKKYLQNEKKCLGDFDLIYPCNDYENQLTKEFESVYLSILPSFTFTRSRKAKPLLRGVSPIKHHESPTVQKTIRPSSPSLLGKSKSFRKKSPQLKNRQLVPTNQKTTETVESVKSISSNTSSRAFCSSAFRVDSKDPDNLEKAESFQELSVFIDKAVTTTISSINKHVCAIENFQNSDNDDDSDDDEKSFNGKEAFQASSPSTQHIFRLSTDSASPLNRRDRNFSMDHSSNVDYVGQLSNYSPVYDDFFHQHYASYRESYLSSFKQLRKL
jgi:hypothetical protein